MMKRDKLADNVKSYISEEVQIKGQIKSRGALRIDGTVEGEVEVEGSLIIGASGSLNGEAKVGDLVLAGKIQGNLYASGKVEIAASGRLNGDVSCSVLTIEEGGFLEGNTKMSNKTSQTLEGDKAREGKKK